MRVCSNKSRKPRKTSPSPPSISKNDAASKNAASKTDAASKNAASKNDGVSKNAASKNDAASQKKGLRTAGAAAKIQCRTPCSEGGQFVYGFWLPDEIEPGAALHHSSYFPGECVSGIRY